MRGMGKSAQSQPRVPRPECPPERSLMTSAPRFMPSSAPALFSAGFRPFFLFGSLYAGVAIALWIPEYFGVIRIETAFSPRDWHMHEMLYGYIVAIVTGFLFTAIPNWTGRLPLRGAPLFGLTLLWLVGRVAIAFSAILGGYLAAFIDSLFLVFVIIAAARELSHGTNNHNLRVLGAVLVLLIGNVVFHVEALVRGSADYGTRIGLAGALILIMLIGGRIVPSFTRNWLARNMPGSLPAPPGRFDLAAIIVATLALLSWTVAPEARATGVTLFLAGAIHLVRLARWSGYRTWRDPRVLVLHVGYLFVPLGFFATGLAAFDLAPLSAGVHLWTIGAIGTMTLAVMTRASLGHTGRALVAGPAAGAIYVLVVGAAISRACAALYPVWSEVLLIASAGAWIAAFVGFAVAYWTILTGRRQGA